MHSAAPPIRINRNDIRAASALLVLGALLAFLTFLDAYGPRLMKRLACVAALGLLCLPLGGCLGLTPAGRAIVGKLPNYEIRQAPKISCSDFLARIDPDQTLTNAQQRAAVKVCEEMTAGVTVDPAALQDAMRQSVPSPF